MVNLQMTVFSWSLEFVTGLVFFSIVVNSNDPETNVDLISGLVIFDAFLNFLVIPSSYILNNEMSKNVIISEGWSKIFLRCKRSNDINPDVNENSEKLSVGPKQPEPIPTISGNIQALENQEMDLVVEDLENNCKMLIANNIFSNV